MKKGCATSLLAIKTKPVETRVYQKYCTVIWGVTVSAPSYFETALWTTWGRRSFVWNSGAGSYGGVVDGVTWKRSCFLYSEWRCRNDRRVWYVIRCPHPCWDGTISKSFSKVERTSRNGLEMTGCMNTYRIIDWKGQQGSNFTTSVWLSCRNWDFAGRCNVLRYCSRMDRAVLAFTKPARFYVRNLTPRAGPGEPFWWKTLWHFMLDKQASQLWNRELRRVSFLRTVSRIDERGRLLGPSIYR